MGIQRHRDLASRCLSFLVLLPDSFYLSLVIVPFLRLLALLCLSALLTQCANSSKKDEPDPKNEKDNTDPVAVGIIEFVNPEQKFVLIKMQSRQPMPTGQVLTALDATGALSELTVSPERKGTHVTADIKSGTPRAGNLVIFKPTPNSTSNTPQPGLAPFAPLPTASPGGGQVEWRDGQPPPIATPETPPLTPPADTLPIIPLGPLPEEPTTPSAP